MLRSREIATPLGDMLAVADDRGLALCEFFDRPMLPTQLERVQVLLHGPIDSGNHRYLDQAERELGEYFAGKREVFTVPLVLDGTTFQMRVWWELLEIPFGATRSYGEMAARVGRPGASRAVGRADGDNRIAVIVPCHRVIGADGSLTGYGGGMRRKKWLLKHEQRALQLGLEGLVD